MYVCARAGSRILFANADSVDVTSVQLTNRYVISVTIMKGIFLNFDHIFAACLTIYGKNDHNFHLTMYLSLII